MRPQTACRIALWLGPLSVGAIVLANMALQDIYHGEPDLTLEWSIVRISFLIIIVFHALAVLELWKAINSTRPSRTSPAGPTN